MQAINGWQRACLLENLEVERVVDIGHDHVRGRAQNWMLSHEVALEHDDVAVVHQSSKLVTVDQGASELVMPEITGERADQVNMVLPREDARDLPGSDGGARHPAIENVSGCDDDPTAR